MAEEKTPETKPKRRVRKVETVREKTAQAEKDTKKGTGRALWRGFTTPVRLLGRGLAKAGRSLGRFRAFRIIGRILWPYYFRNSWKELRLVTWPTGRQSRQLTLAVMVFATIFGVVIALLDYGLDKVFKQVLVK